ncbi:hypothetical protein BGX27_003313 [Mortierella sp. AM989]|nr:hypothetical protein BGX27_003313 [Mortierella sp. AM989]
MSQQQIANSDLSMISTGIEDESFIGSGVEEDQSLHNEQLQSTVSLQEQSFGDAPDFPIPENHPGYDFFHETPFNRINHGSYVNARREAAQRNRQQVASEWNGAMKYIRTKKRNISLTNALQELRKIPPMHGNLSKSLVSQYLKSLEAVQGVVDLNATSSDEQVEALTTPTSPSTKSTSSRQVSEVDFSSGEVLRTEFEFNFSNFNGPSLTLPSGANFDQVFFQRVMLLKSQSGMHSGIIDRHNLATFAQLFEEGDVGYLKQLAEGPNDHAEDISIEDWKINVINHYMTAYTVEDVVFKGWENLYVLEGSTPQGYRPFVKMIIDFMNDVLETYKEFGEELVGDEIKLPRGLPEKAYLRLWGIFFRVLSKNCRLVRLAEGEISSTASAIRRNEGRTRDDRQNGGHKLDAIFYVTRASDSEFGAVEGGKKNENSYGTKYLTDGLKLSKSLKDMFDNICTRALSNGSDVNSLKSTLQVYGFLVSGEKIEFLTLRSFGGRYYFMDKISEHFLPTQLHEDTFSKIRNLLQEFLSIGKRMEKTSKLIVRHVDGEMGTCKSGKQGVKEHMFPPTLTTPPPSPKTKRAKVCYTFSKLPQDLNDILDDVDEEHYEESWLGNSWHGPDPDGIEEISDLDIYYISV